MTFVAIIILSFMAINFSSCRYWAVAVPSFVIVSALVGVVMYAGLNCMMVVPFNDPRSVQGTTPLL